MQIKLKQISYRNFKGLVSFDLSLDPISTHIYGDNGTGKTSLMDGFMWLLFGKDSESRTDFNIKTLDSNSEALHRLDHEVNAVFDIDGIDTTCRRIYKEKWTKKKGDEVAVFDGHVQEFFFNNVPCSQKEYNEKVSGIIKEEMFKLLTSPMYFNSLPWQKRREILFSIANPVSNDYLASINPDYEVLVQNLTRKSVDEFKKELVSKKKLLKDQLINIPARIDEADRNKPEPPDIESINGIVADKNKRIAEIDAIIADGQKAIENQMQAYQAAMNEKNQLITKVADLKREDSIKAISRTSELEGKLNIERNKFNQSQRNLDATKESIDTSNNAIDKLSNELTMLRSSWSTINAEELKFSNDTTCPTCKQSLPAGDIATQREEQQNNFNASKSERLAEVTKKANLVKERIEQFKAIVHENKIKYDQLTNEQQAIIKEIEQYEKLIDDVNIQPALANPLIEQLQLQIDAFVLPELTRIDNSALLAEKTGLQAEINAISAKLNNTKIIIDINARIDELMKQEQELNQSLAELEKTEYLIAQFSKDKIEIIEKEINSMFSMVKWKMFEQQVNGGESECCVCMVNGVPYNDVNTAGKINAGIDIINTFIAKYGISAPIWVDNKESINNLLPTQAQVITLNVSKEKSLTIIN